MDICKLQEIFGNQKYDQICLFQYLFNSIIPLLAHRDLSIVKCGDEPLVAQSAEVGGHLLEPMLVLLRVGDEHLNRCRRAHGNISLGYGRIGD